MTPRTAPLALLLAAACARPSARPVAPAGGVAACFLLKGSTARAPAVTIALPDLVDPAHAPVPQNDAERIVFAQLYETLLRFDCEGHPLPGLAESWASSDGGRRWTLTLRADAQFWDGAPVTARDVVVGKSGAGFTLSPAGDRAVTVLLARGTDAVPAFLSDPALAVTKPAPDRGWPIGTGRWWVTGATTTDQEIRAVTSGGQGDTLVFRIPQGRDPRDLLDAGVDLLVTRDPGVLQYVATRGEWTALELPWDRTYVLAGAQASAARLDGLEQAVRAESRRAAQPFWWQDLGTCAAAPAAPPATTSHGAARTVYRRGDPTARDLAARIAALSGGAAAALPPADFAQALAAGSEAGYVVALPRLAADPCRAARDLLPAWHATLAPLVDARARAVVRRGSSLWVTVDMDGSVRLAPPPPLSPP